MMMNVKYGEQCRVSRSCYFDANVEVRVAAGKFTSGSQTGHRLPKPGIRHS